MGMGCLKRCHLLLLLTYLLSQERKPLSEAVNASEVSTRSQPTWSDLADTLLYRCVADTSLSLTESLKSQNRCFVRGQCLLQCVPVVRALKTYDYNAIHRLPCGTISFSQEVFRLEGRVEELEWSIKVPKYFDLNVTFYHFNLPTPYGKCRNEKFRRSGSIAGKNYVERVTIHRYGASNVESDHHLCGKRRPFWLTFAVSHIQITYSCIDHNICRGFFLAQHQVCDPKTCGVDVTSRPVNHLQLSGSKRKVARASLASFSFIRIGSLIQAYSVHITADKLSRVRLSLGRASPASYDRPFAIAVYDGPYSHPDYLHPENYILYQWQSITSVTFQCFVHIECFSVECEHLQIHYSYVNYMPEYVPRTRWRDISSTGIYSLWANGSSCNGLSLSERPNLLYCMWHIENGDPSGTVHVSFNSLSLGWFDAVGGWETILCPLAGATIVDNLRQKLLVDPAEHDTDVIDVLFPEITQCGKVPMLATDGSSTVVYDLPMRSWTSTSSRITILVYAYGSLVDLEELYVFLNISKDTCVGLFLSCLEAQRDSLVETGSVVSHNMKYLDSIKVQRCPSAVKNTYVIAMSPWKKFPSLRLLIIYCSLNSGSYLSAEVLKTEPHPLCLNVQYHPYFAQNTEYSCTVTYSSGSFSFNYQLETSSPWSSFCARHTLLSKPSYSILEPNFNSFHKVVPGAKAKGKSVKIKAKGFGRCFSFKLKILIHQSCEVKHIERAYLEENSIIQDLSQWFLPTLCSTYRTPIALVNGSVIVSVTLANALNELVINVLKTNKRDELWLLKRNAQYGQLGLEVRSELNDFCYLNCSQFVLFIAYTEPGAGKYVLLEWAVQGRQYVVSVAQVAVAQWLVYVKVSVRSTPCDLLKCELSLQVRSSDLYPRQEDVALTTGGTVPFARYYYLWTSKQYTWQESEELCQTAGLHLASITSETEYNIVRGMLYGETRTSDASQETPILTPCRVEFVLCLMYIGLHNSGVRKTFDHICVVCNLQYNFPSYVSPYYTAFMYVVFRRKPAPDGTWVTKMQLCTVCLQKERLRWLGGRPAAFLRYGEIYAKGKGPSQIVVADSSPPFRAIDLQRIITSATFRRQPSEKQGEDCTALIGSPGPLNMEFVSVPCDVKHSVSGIICMSTERKADESRNITYALYHIRSLSDEVVTSSVFGSNVTYFNIDRFNRSVLLANNIRRNLSDYFESSVNTTQPELLSAEVYKLYMKQVAEGRKTHKRSWMEEYGRCKDMGFFFMSGGKIPCTAFANSAVQVLHKTVFIPEKEGPPNSSVDFKHGILTGQTHCGRSWMLLDNRCFRLTKLGDAQIWKSGALSLICAQFIDTSPFVVTSPSQQELLDTMLKTFNLETGQVAFLTKDDNCTSYYGDRRDPYDTCSYGSVQYALCVTKPIKTECLESHFTCGNGECIPDRYHCDGNTDCPSGEDEKNCSWLCSAPFEATSEFCRESCHSDNCTCTHLFWHCQIGGCIHSSRLCDGTVDCKDGEDEVICEQCQTCGSTTLEPDHTPFSLIVDPSVSEVTCNAEVELPCSEGSGICHPIAKRCLFEQDTENKLIHYCTNAKHLLDCERVECSGTYKCRLSYCLPTYKVCNGVTDCPYGDDEAFCPLKACPSLFRCETSSCIHPLNICDGVKHCPSGEDEKQCQMSSCPPGCQCTGLSLVCVGVQMPPASYFLKSKARILTLSKLTEVLIQVVTEIIETQHTLLILNLSENETPLLSEIGMSLQLTCLVELDLSSNKFTMLERGMFVGLSYLQRLSLSRNPITYINQRSFDGLTNLRRLLLSHTSISTLSLDIFSGFQHLDLLDISQSSLNKIANPCPKNVTIKVFNVTGNSLISIGNHYCRKNIFLVSDQKELCCLRDLLLESPPTFFHNRARCSRLLLRFTATVLLVTFIVSLCVLNAAVLIYHMNQKSQVSSLISSLAISNMLVAEPLLVAVVWDLYYGTEIGFWKQTLIKNPLCKITSHIMLMTSQMSSSFLLYLSWVKYAGTIKKTTNNQITSNSKSRLLVVTSCIWFSWTSLVVVLYFTKSKVEKVHFCLTLYLSNDTSYIGLMSVGYSVVCCLMTAVFYAGILRTTWHAGNVGVGRRHGRDVYKAVSRQLCIIIVCTLFSTLPSAAVMVTIILSPVGSLSLMSTVWLVGMSHLPAMCNPFLYTFFTRRFIRSLMGQWRSICNQTQ